MAGYLAAFERAARWFDRIQAGESVLHTPPATMAAARVRHHARTLARILFSPA